MSQIILATGKQWLPGQECTCVCQGWTQPLSTLTHSFKLLLGLRKLKSVSKHTANAPSSLKRNKNANKC